MTLTITGWINNQVQVAGSGGNRIVSWINHGGDGVDLVYQSNGSLRLGVDQWPDYTPAFSSPNKVTTLNNPTLQSTNWIFFAVTYRSNGQVEYYFGKPDALATLGKCHQILCRARHYGIQHRYSCIGELQFRDTESINI